MPTDIGEGKLLSFHEYFKKELKVLLILLTAIVIAVTTVDVITVLSVHKGTFQFLPLIIVFVIVLILVILGKIRYDIGFGIDIYALVLNSIYLLWQVSDNSTNYELVFMRESVIFVAYYLGASLFLKPFHCFVVLGSYVFILLYVIIKGDLPFLEDNLAYLILLNSFTAFLSFIFSRKMRKGIVNMQKNNLIIEKQNNQLSEQNAILEEANVSKDKLFSIISHDLKNPLNIILGYTEILIRKYDKYDDVKRKELLNQLADSGNRLHELLNKLLQWARTQTKRIKTQPIKFSISRLIENEILSIQDMAQSKNIQLEFNYTEQYKVLADVEMISTVLRNILSNAIKFTFQDGIVSVNIHPSKDNNELLISIEDNGAGMDVETRENLFLIDNHESNSGTEGEKGTGLGLLISKEFVELNGGSIHAESILGEGTKVTFSLPMYQS